MNALPAMATSEVGRRHVRHNRALQRHVLAVTTVTESVPWVADEMRGTVTLAARNFWRAIAHYGFMERSEIPRLLRQLEKRGCTIDLADVTYFVGHETVTRREDGNSLPHWQEAVFAVMERNAAHLMDFLNPPGDQVVKIGRQISI